MSRYQTYPAYTPSLGGLHIPATTLCTLWKVYKSNLISLTSADEINNTHDQPRNF